ncbi:hypothetical protein LINPERPRIM_LOCUS38946 [Linum perenne]
MAFFTMPRTCSTKCLDETSSLRTPSYPPTSNLTPWSTLGLSLTLLLSEIPSLATICCLVTFGSVGLSV